MDTTKKADNSKIVFGIMILLMILTAVYMSFVIKTVPRTVESSKVGPFPELLEAVIAFHQQEGLEAGQPSLDRDAVNAELQRLVPYEGLALKRKSAESYQLLAATTSRLVERELLQVKLKHPEGTVFSVSVFPISKRHFPKTRSFVYKDSWLFQYGKDLVGAENLPETAHIASLEKAGLNLIATNYGNDYYILLTGDAPADAMAKWLFEATTIFSPRK